MASSVEAKVINGLMTHFKAIALPAGVKVAYPNKNFTPDGREYIRLSIRKNTPTNPHIAGAPTIYRGWPDRRRTASAV